MLKCPFSLHLTFEIKMAINLTLIIPDSHLGNYDPRQAESLNLGFLWMLLAARVQASNPNQCLL